jgi:hypothetical protein
MLTCETCGKVHTDGTAVCDVCGTGLAAWPYLANSPLAAELGLDRLPADSDLSRDLAGPLRELTGTRCPACGQSNRPGASFCAVCGHALTTTGSLSSGDGVGGLAAGQVLHTRYHIVRRVARGGMGAVYEARDLQTPGSRLAIKEMAQAGIAPDERTQTLKDFMREATLLATLDHPNLPTFEGIFSEDGKYYLIMEFVQGHTLESLLANTRGFLSEHRVLGWAAQLCDALNYLHRQQPPIIYRDMKPGNIMLTDGSDHIKLIDFGIARFHRRGPAQEGASYGTAGYAPPEQYGNGQTDERSDVYALAATLHHLLSGHDPAQNPFHWKPVRAINPHVTRRVDQAIMRALELRADERFPTIDAFAQALGLRPMPAAVPQQPWEAGRRVAVGGRGAGVGSRAGDGRATAVPTIAAGGDGAGTAVPVDTAQPATASGPRPPIADPQAAPHLELSETTLDLGLAGRTARRGRKINLLNHGGGQLKGIVQATQPWLAVSAVQFQGNVGEVTVGVRPRGLRYGQETWPVPNVFRRAWQAAGRPGVRLGLLAWFVAGVWLGSLADLSAFTALITSGWVLAGLLVAAQVGLWTVARHVRWIVPAPLVNQGEVIVDSNGGQRRVAVQVMARPAALRRGLAWLLVTILLVVELVALILGGLVVSGLVNINL